MGQRLGQGRRLEGKRKDGSLFPLLVTLSEVAGMGPNRRQFTAAMRDISQLMFVASELSTEKYVAVVVTFFLWFALSLRCGETTVPRLNVCMFILKAG